MAGKESCAKHQQLPDTAQIHISDEPKRKTHLKKCQKNELKLRILADPQKLYFF